MTNVLSQSLARALNVSTESVDVDINIGNDAVVDEDGAAVSPLSPVTDEPIIEAQETELVEESSGIEETADNLEETEGDIETLESIQTKLIDANTNGGLDSVSYEMFNITMDHIYRKHGITASNVFPSMESFGEDRVGQTELSMEKVGETIKTFKSGAANFLKEMWFKIKQFVTNVIKLNFSMKKRIEAVIKQADKAGDNSGAGEIKLYSANRLHIGGKIPDKSQIISAYADTTTGLQSLGGAMHDYFAAVSLAQQYAMKGETDFNEYLGTLSAQAETQIKLAERLRFQDAKLVGKSTAKDGSVSGITLETTPGPKGDDAKVKPLSPAEVKTVCKNMLNSLDTIKKLGDQYSNKKLEKDITGDADKTPKEVKSAIKDAMRTHGRVINYMNSVNKGMLDYCVQSLQAKDAKVAASDSADKPADTSTKNLGYANA